MKPTQKWYRCTKAFPGVKEGTTFRTVEAHITTAFLLKEDLDHVMHETFATDHPEYFEQYDPEEKTKQEEPLNIEVFTEKLIKLCEEHEMAIFIMMADKDKNGTVTYANTSNHEIIGTLVGKLMEAGKEAKKAANSITSKIISSILEDIISEKK